LAALPDDRKETLKFPRSYLANVIHTICGDPFAQWTKARIQARNAKVTQDRNLDIDLDPEIAQIYRQVRVHIVIQSTQF